MVSIFRPRNILYDKLKTFGSTADSVVRKNSEKRLSQSNRVISISSAVALDFPETKYAFSLKFISFVM